MNETAGTHSIESRFATRVKDDVHSSGVRYPGFLSYGVDEGGVK